MAVSVVSLVGFLEADAALQYLGALYVAEDCSPEALLQLWQEAQAKLGQAIGTPGRPSVMDIPDEYEEYLQGVVNSPRFQWTIRGMTSYQFKLVEIDPLLAFQYHIELKRSDHHGSTLSEEPTITKMLEVCLPREMEDIPLASRVSQNELWISSPSTNVLFFERGAFSTQEPTKAVIGGVEIAPNTPLVHVARFDGRYYLRNGFHRMLTTRKAGATHFPCLVVDAPSFDSVVGNREGRFSEELLCSENPPTCGHFAQDHAVELAFRKVTKVIHVTWSETTFVEHD